MCVFTDLEATEAETMTLGDIFAQLKPTYTYIEKDDFVTVVVTAPKVFGGGTNRLHLTPDQYKRFKWWRDSHGLIQELLPDLSNSERELLMTGMTDDVFAEKTGGTDDGIGPL
jgi:hypothetical protein